MTKSKLGQDPFKEEKALPYIQDSQEGLKKRRGPGPASDRAEWEVASFIIKKSVHKQIRDISWWERRPIKTIFNEALEAYLAVHPKPKLPK